jgi:hypothetical protein
LGGVVELVVTFVLALPPRARSLGRAVRSRRRP